MKKDNWFKRHPVWTGIIGLVILAIIIGQFLPEDNSTGEESVINYEILESSANPTAENFYILISLSDISEENINLLVNFINENECKKKCNILVYDDKQAYILDKQAEEINSISEKTAWEEENYVFVAEHLVALRYFDVDTHWMYPFKDWKYEELKL